MEPQPTRDLRPLAVTATVAAVTGALLVAAVVGGWLGADVGRGANFCEADHPGLVKQPVNTWTNLGFVLAGLAVAWRAGLPQHLGSVLRSLPGVALAYAVVVVLIGPASAAMHATQTEWGGYLDLFSMYLVASAIASYALTRLLRRDRRFLLVAFVVGVVACQAVALAFPGQVPVVTYAGNVAFALLLLTAVVVEVVVTRRGETTRDLRWGGAALASILVAFGIWNLGKGSWCDPDGLLQAHGAWHLLCALAAWCLFRLHATEEPR